eukprot:gene29707-38838_t
MSGNTATSGSRVPIISALLDDLDFGDPRTITNKEDQKLFMLHDEILSALKKSNYVSQICQSFETSHRQKDYLINLCKFLKFSSGTCVALAYSLLQSQYRMFGADACKLLQAKLPEVINSNSFSDMSDDVIQGLFQFLYNNEDILPQEVSAAYFSAVKSIQSQSTMHAGSSAGGNFFGGKSISGFDSSDLPAIHKLVDSSRIRMTIGSILYDVGPQCTATTDSFQKILHSFGIKIDEEQLASILLVVVARPSHNDSEERKAELLANPWNLENVADVLNSECRGFNWNQVAKNLDMHLLNVRTESEIQLLLRLFVRVSGSTVPPMGLLPQWTNKVAQLHILGVAANSPRNVVDFSGMISAEQIITGDVPTPQNLSWLCVQLYLRLLELANSGMNGEVLDLLSKAAALFPEYVLMSLAQVQEPNSAVRSEILRRLLPLFTGLQGTRPTSVAVMRKLNNVNPELLIILCRIALKKARKVWEISNIDTLLKSLGPSIIRRLDEDGSAEELLSLWCFKADRLELALDERCQALLEVNPKHSRLFVAFVKTHGENMRPRLAQNQNDGLLSCENFATIFRVVQSNPTVLSVEEVRTLGAVFNQHQNIMQSSHQPPHHLFSNQQLSSVGNNNGVQNTIESANDNAFGGEQPELMRLPPGPESDEIEALANSYFQKIYTSDLTISDVIGMLRQFKSSSEKREQEIFRCMIHNLFDEYRFFHKYPEKELQVTGRLFGSLVHHQLVSSITLGIALRYVLEALRKDPDHGEGNDKMFRFGKIALEQFRSRLGEWPQYCSHLIQIPHLGRHCPELYQETQKALNTPQLQHLAPSSTGLVSMSMQQHGLSGAVGSAALNSDRDSSIGLTQQFANMNIINSPIVSENVRLNANAQASPIPSRLSAPADNIGMSAISIGGSAAVTSAPSAPPVATTAPTPAPDSKSATEQQSDGHVKEISRMAEVNVDVLSSPLPPDSIRDQIHFIVNNIAKNNFESKSFEIKEILKTDHFNWFANYLVVKRISTQPNLHQMYLSILDSLELPALIKLVLDSSYHNVTKLLQSPNITTSSSERSLLRNLGVWIGQMTLARNKPLLQRRINLKELLFWGFETGRLIAVCSFVAKVLEGVKDSKVFRPPNPWLMALLGIMRELYEIEDLKLNIKFEVQVLCKNINIKIEDIPKANALSQCKMPVKDQRNPDFNMKSSSAASAYIGVNPVITTSPVVTQSVPATPIPHAQQQLPPVEPLLLPAGAREESDAKATGPVPPTYSGVTSGGIALPAPSGEQVPQQGSALNNLALSVNINPNIQFFVNNPSQRRFVLVAVERGIKEIIQSAVERSVAIASATTQQLILKDFSTEPNEQVLRNGAHYMISSLAGSLALATCKEPLRISIGNHLRTLLAQSISDQVVIEQIVQVCSNENVEIGSLLIEKTAVDKSMKEIDNALSSAYAARKKAKEAGQAFVDTSITQQAGKYPAELHEMLKPREGGVSQQQFQVYDAFQRVKLVPPAPATPQASHLPQASPSPSASILSHSGNIETIKALPPASSAPSQPQQPPMLTMAQALEAYQGILAVIDSALKAVQVQAQGREVTIPMLGTEHELVVAMRNVISVAQRTQTNVRYDTAITFAENIFNRMFESIGSPDPLRLEVFVAMLESIREACGGSKAFAPDFINWLGKYAVLVNNDDTSRRMYRLILILLLRAKLIRPTDVDMYFVMYIDGGRNLFWLELALSFIRSCLLEGLASIYDFANTLDTVTKMRPTNMVLKRQLQKWLQDIKVLTMAQEEQKANAAANSSAAGPQPASVAPSGGAVGAASSTARDSPVREQVAVLLDRWLRVWNSITDQIFSQYLQIMHQYGVLKTEEAADRFFRVATEICCEACIKSGQSAQQGAEPSNGLNFMVIDALSKLFLLLVRLADKEASDINVRVNLLSRILNAIAKTLVEDHERQKNNKTGGPSFDQRPYFRLLANLSQDLGVPEPKQEPNVAILPVLHAYTQVFLQLQPTSVPGFAYAWSQLISRRSFMPNVLLFKGQKGWPYMHRILSALLHFLQPFLRSTQLVEAIRKLYKGTLRILLVLLHDFPEFLCDFHLSFCDLIPLNCVQLRNLILSAFPRTMRLPDPFMPNLKVDVLNDISQSPRILTDYVAPMTMMGVRGHLDSYLNTKQPAELPSKLHSVLGTTSGGYNTPLITSIVVYVGSLAIIQVQNKMPIQNSPAMDIYKQLLYSLDAEGRYLLLNTMANQLRYPNSHTHFFSYVMLNLFFDSEDKEFVQEQITRVLLERLIVHRPHPWGLLITFIELIKNPRYSFWRKSFTRGAPEIERVFENMARTCIGPTASALIQLQLSTPSKIPLPLSHNPQPFPHTYTISGQFPTPLASVERCLEIPL